MNRWFLVGFDHGRDFNSKVHRWSISLKGFFPRLSVSLQKMLLKSFVTWTDNLFKCKVKLTNERSCPRKWCNHLKWCSEVAYLDCQNCTFTVISVIITAICFCFSENYNWDLVKNCLHKIRTLSWCLQMCSLELYTKPNLL